MRKLAPFCLLLLLSCSFTACDDSAPSAPPPEEEEPMGGGGSGEAGGGGQVTLQGGEGGGTIADRYEKALQMIRDRDWDGARAELLEALARTEDPGLQKDIKGHLGLVEKGILAQPTYTAPEVFGAGDKMMEKNVSMRGKFLNGGPVGKVSYYFWLDSGAKIQCRYAALPLDQKKTVLLLKDGAQVLVRGTLKSPWGSNPNPYLELSYFRLEKLSPQQEAEQSKDKE